MPMNPGDWISLAGMGGTAVAVVVGLRLAAGRNADALRVLGGRVGAVEEVLQNGRFASKELVEEQFRGVNKRLDGFERSLERIEGHSGCKFPNCPPGFHEGGGR